ncbi:hypothetical protein KJ756_02550 [Patescibacteria group bacterium]|nr:hypothetical protein [Patescibacteria group bacterium]MBU2579969.1 hypothetical protein [Patescibacteria group bacterium]MBU4031009.1 hypothetical protein [Patescibacteria group bacterium]MBU4082603.1 hypothetical protein [Patescibacteria group bacterium]
MTLIIDLSGEKLCLVLKLGKKQIAVHKWDGLYQLSETLLVELDKFLKKNKINLSDIKKFKVIPSEKSIISDRIAQAVVLGLTNSSMLVE